MQWSRRSLRIATLAMGATLLLAAPTTAADGWLDPTFSRDGVEWLPTDEAQAPGVARVAVRAGPTGRVFLGRQLSYGDDADALDVLALGSNGAIAGGFNGGDWTTKLLSDETTATLGLYPTTDSGVIAALYDGYDRLLIMGRYGPGGGLTQQRKISFTASQGGARSSLENGFRVVPSGCAIATKATTSPGSSG